MSKIPRKKCIDCGKKLGISSAYTIVKRCHACNTIHLFKTHKLNQSGKNHSQYKNGLPKCIDCGKELKNYYAKRCHSCCQKGILHPNLKGIKNGMFKKTHNENTKKKISLALGGTGIPYEFSKYNKNLFTKRLKEQIRERDNYKCQHCGIIEKEHLMVNNQVLHVHHIDYNKLNCEENNLITTCIKCNTFANINRDYWFAYFTYIMENYVD